MWAVERSDQGSHTCLERSDHAGSRLAAIGTTGKTWTTATVACPRPEHAGSHVRLDGQFGEPGRRRQRYRCIPANGDSPHRFAAALTPPPPGDDQLLAHGIAGALAAAGAGLPYRRAACVAGERARQLREQPNSVEPQLERRAQLVMAWVERFAPVVFEPHRPTAWPSSGTLLLEHFPLIMRDPLSGAEQIAVQILCAAGYLNDGLRLWRLEAFPDDSRSSWATFLGSLDGAPQRVVSDGGPGLTEALRATFGEAELYVCQRHLHDSLMRSMTEIHDDVSDHRAAIDALRPRVEGALASASFWHAFVRDALAADVPGLTLWLKSRGSVVDEQLRRHGSSIRPRSMPLTTAPIDGLIQPIRDSITPRRSGFKSPARLSRLLMLMQLHANHQADERAYADAIGAWLQSNRRLPDVARRVRADVARIGSL